MSTGRRVALFVAVVATAFGTGAAIGAVAGPIDVGPGHDLEHGHQTHEPEVTVGDD